MHIGYARISTDDQNLDLQQDALGQARVGKSYEDKASGKSLGRPQLAECLRSLRKGDTLIVWRLDRLGRSSNESIRRWVLKFGPIIAKNLRAIRPKPHSRGHLDEMMVSIAGSTATGPLL
jgi:predicted site-specific integrase-resolvase